MPYRLFRPFRCLSALLLAAALLCPASSLAEPQVLSSDVPDAEAFDPLAGVRFAAPGGFLELPADSPLFRQSETEAVRSGRLLKLYLPRHIAAQYRSGSPDAVTRQVLVCSPEGQTKPLNDKDRELLARAAEGYFVGFARIPHSRTDTPAQAEENRARALRSSLETGRPLLADSLRTSSAYLHTCLVHFAMSGAEKAGGQERAWLPCALAVAAVPVRDTMLFVTVSSLLGQEGAEAHLSWVKETASAFADAIVKASRPEKK